MFDFSDVCPSSKDEQIRAWCVEQSIDHLRGTGAVYQDVITLAKMAEDFIVNGDVSGVIQTAIEEGYSEGRYQLREALAGHVDVRVLERIWREYHWSPEEGN